MLIRIGLILTPLLTTIPTIAEWEKTVLRTETAKVVIVPEISRIMQFRLIGKPGVLWNAPELLNKPTDPTGIKWQNFGGEKVWPAPEKDWDHFSSRETWLPPVGFDATPAALTETTPTSTTMTWPEDDKTGLLMSRNVSLKNSTLSIKTTWKRLTPGPSPLSIWTIAQFRDPREMHIAKPAFFQLPPDIIQLSKALPPSLREHPASYSLTRDPKTAYKIGTAGTDLLWADDETLCHIHIDATPGGIQPDAGSRVQIYTNADAKPYVELETLGPLEIIPVGTEISQTTTYTLLARNPGQPLLKQQPLDSGTVDPN